MKFYHTNFIAAIIIAFLGVVELHRRTYLAATIDALLCAINVYFGLMSRKYYDR